ncbi:MAG TPA: 6-phosphogluconolactonase [Opitutaceae bacterium]
MNTPPRSLPFPERPHTTIHADRRTMGAAAARLVQDELARVVAAQGRARIVMACAPSQDDYYAALIPLARATPEIWSRIHVFHMDDYVGLTAAHPQSFRHYLQTHFLDHVAVAAFHPLQAEAADIAAEAQRYDAALAAEPIDVISLGIGENGHLAFNDPPVADFADPVRVKIVELDPICRQQQVNDGCFPSVDAVPRHALTLTLPVFTAAGLLACIVPTARKAPAVRATLLDPIGPACPATLLRQHPRAHLFLDEPAAALLPK